MKRKRYFTAILGLILTAGMFLAGCDLTTNPSKKGPGSSNGGELDGTWKYGSYEITIDGDNYVMKYSGTNYGKGTITYSVANSTFTFQSTHEWTGSAWSPNTRDRTNGKLTYGGGNTLTISNLDNYTFLAGTWTRQSSPTGNTDNKTINITDFPRSAYSGKVAVITLHPSLMTEEVTAVGVISINSNTLNIPLYTDESLKTRWKGTGDYYVLLMIGNSGGKIENVFIFSREEPDYFGTNVPKYSITKPESTIPYSELLDITEWAIENDLM
jgi:hypothetical protein